MVETSISQYVQQRNQDALMNNIVHYVECVANTENGPVDNHSSQDKELLSNFPSIEESLKLKKEFK